MLALTILPPYYAGFWDKSDSHSGDADFNTILDGTANNVTGEIYSLNQNYVHNPGDSASQVTQASAHMQFNFQSPVHGSLRMVATLENLESYYNGSMVDESGFTNATVTQNSNLRMFEPGQGGQTYYLSNYSRGDDDGTWYSRIAEPGELRQFECVPRVETDYTVGEWVLLELQIYDYHHAWVNDMKFRQNHKLLEHQKS